MNLALFFLTLAGMELVAWTAHRYVMHGWGWGWHASHHRPRQGWFERNDLYAVVFAGIAIVLIALGTSGLPPLQWIGAGMTAYGLLYFLAHDGLVHRRGPLGWLLRGRVPQRGYLKRLYLAHRLHHAVQAREGCVSFGFLIAPSPARLRNQLRALRVARTTATRATATMPPSGAATATASAAAVTPRPE